MKTILKKIVPGGFTLKIQYTHSNSKPSVYFNFDETTLNFRAQRLQFKDQQIKNQKIK